MIMFGLYTLYIPNMIATIHAIVKFFSSAPRVMLIVSVVAMKNQCFHILTLLYRDSVSSIIVPIITPRVIDMIVCIPCIFGLSPSVVSSKVSTCFSSCSSSSICIVLVVVRVIA